MNNAFDIEQQMKNEKSSLETEAVIMASKWNWMHWKRNKIIIATKVYLIFAFKSSLTIFFSDYHYITLLELAYVTYVTYL